MIKAGLLSLALQCSPQVHPDTVFDVAKTESGYNPYAIAEIIPKAERKAAGKSLVSHMPASKAEALKIVDAIEKKGRRYSVGLMQITSTNFRQYSTTAERLFDPCHNLKVAEKILLDCWQRSGKLKNALSCYYSGDPMTGQKREKEFSDTSYIERIAGKPLAPTKEVIVPSTRELKQPTKKSSPRQLAVIYPNYIVRGSVTPIQTQGKTND